MDNFRSSVLYYALAIALIYLLVALFAPLVLNGTLYHVESPIQVTVENGVIHTKAHRVSLVSSPATNATRVICDGVQYQFEVRYGSVIRGEGDLVAAFPAPHALSGSCILKGLIEYSPAPFIFLQHEWYSETFELP